MPSIFTRILRGEIPCHEVGRSERFLAFLDIHPLREGHTLVIPHVEVDKLFDLDDDLLAGMLPFAKEVACRIEKVVPCARVGVAVLGLEVPHAHLHLVPMDSERDLEFSRPKLKMGQEELAALAKRIREA